jgi:hypothetical protein
VSSASLGFLLNLEERYHSGRLTPRGVIVRNHHPGGAFGLCGEPDALVAGGRVWSLDRRLIWAIGRLMSGPPVSAEEFARLSSLSERQGMEAVMELVRSGLCEPCAPSEPLI